MKAEQFNFGCSTSEDYIRQYVLEFFIHVTMEFIHKNILRQAKGFNAYVKDSFFTAYKEKEGDVHPIVEILHHNVKGLNDLEYGASSDPIAETEKYYKMKVNLKDFTLLPNDISKVYNNSGHSNNQRARAYLSNDLIDILMKVDRQRCDELSSFEPLEEK